MDSRQRHLEFIKGVINKHAKNSMLIKGWSLGLVAGLFVLAVINFDITFLRLAYIPAAICWGLDAYFLTIEKDYRELYDVIRKKVDVDIDYALNFEGLKNKTRPLWSAIISKSLIIYYGFLIGSITVVMLWISQ